MVPRASRAVSRKRLPNRNSSPGKPSKCSCGEFVYTAETFVGKYRRNVYRAMKGDGPSQVAPKFSHLEVTEEV